MITNGTSTLSPNEKAYQGTNCINLVGANGCGISTNIATVPGITYTLDFAYTKNPDTVSGQFGVVIDGNPLGNITANQHNAWSSLRWQTASLVFTATSNLTYLAFVYTNNPGLSNVLLDAIGWTTNLTETVAYANGEVATAFYYDGASNRLVVPDAPVLNFGSNADFSIDGWISPLMPPPDPTTGVMSFVDKRYSPNSSVCQGYEFSLINGAMFLHLSDNIAASGQAWLSSGYDLRDGRMHHVAVSVKRNSTTGGNMYVDGARVLQFDPTSVPGDLTPSPAQPLLIGNHPDPTYYSFFKGRIDETSIYRRALSASEIKAIYAGGTNGKFDPVVFNSSPSRSLAEAQIRLTGQSPITILGNNTNWQTYTAAFKAVSAQTTLTLAGVEPGMLLGPMVVTLQTTNVITNNLCLTFTENTNLTTTPVKYLPTPFTNSMVPVLIATTTTNTITNWFNGFEGGGPGTYGAGAGTYFAGGWYVEGPDYVDVLANGYKGSTAYQGNYDIDLNGGGASGISTNIVTAASLTYTLNFAYAKNPDLGAGIAHAGILIGSNSPIIITANQANSWANLGWQTTSYVFTATSPSTHLAFISTNTPGVSGVLLDAVNLTTLATNYTYTTNQVMTNYYILPEQSLDAFSGENAQGLWQLEIQDDRAGAGLTNLLVSWQLQFVLGNTTAIPGVLSGGIGQTNQFIPAGDIAWYQITVPALANWAVNRLLFASAPVNVWFDTNSPPTTNIFFFNGTSVSNLLSITNPPVQLPPTLPSPKIYQGQTYYLGVQNPNAFTVNYGIEVDFVTASGQPAIAVSPSSGSATLKWSASPTAQFQVKWTDDLTQPWQTDTNVITSSDGNFTFTDDGSQTAPLGPKRFYQLVQIVP